MKTKTKCPYCSASITRKDRDACNKCHNNPERRLKFRPDLVQMNWFLYGRRRP